MVTIVLLAAELGTRVAAPRFDEPLEWYTYTARAKANQMDELSRIGGAAVVFVGTSMTRDGMDPEVFLEANVPTNSAYNAALSNGSPTIMSDWIENEVVPRLNPDVVVWGLESYALNDASETLQESTDLYHSSPRAQRDPASRFETWIDEHIYLFRYQQVLRSPLGMAAAFGLVPGKLTPDTPGDQGSLTEMTPLGRTLGRADKLSIHADTRNSSSDST